MPDKDIFGNPIQQGMSTYKKPMSYTQKLKEAKAKQKYKAYQQEQRKMQVEKFKQNAQKSKEGLQRLGSKAKAGYARATDKKMSLRDRLRGSIYKKE